MEEPLVSVIIPTYNRALILKETIQSVLEQTYERLELIVIDDGSTDDTQAVVDGFKDERIIYIKQEHKGLPSARNKGIENAKGEYIAFLDSDDMWLPEKIDKQLKIFNKNKLKLGVVYCGVEYIDEKSRKAKEKKLPAYKGNIFLELLGARRNVVLGAGSTVLVKKECFQRCGLLDENLPYRVDLELLIRISKKFHFDYVPETLVKIRIHDKRMSFNLDTVIKGRELLFEKIYNDLRQHKKILAKYYYQTGMLYMQKGNRRKSKEYMFKSIRIFPLMRALKELIAR